MNWFFRNRQRVLSAVLSLGLAVSGVSPLHAETAPPQLFPGERLAPLILPDDGKLLLKGWVKSDKATVYTLKVKAGDKVELDYKTSSKFSILLVFDLAHPDDEAIFGSDTDGKSAQLVAEADTTWLIRPYFTRIAPRRGLGAQYSISIDGKATFTPKKKSACGPLGNIC